MTEGRNPPDRNFETRFISCANPSFLYGITRPYKMIGNSTSLVLGNCRQCRNRPNAFRPVGAADKRVLCRLHHIFSSDNRRHREPVAHRFCEYSDIGFHSMQQVSSTGSQPETGRYFIGDQDCIIFVCNFPDISKKPGCRIMIPDRFQDYGRKFIRMTLNDRFQFLCMIVLERKGSSCQPPGHTGRSKTRQKVTVEISVICKISCKIPVMPPVVATECHHILFCMCPSYTDCNCHGFPTAPGIP